LKILTKEVRIMAEILKQGCVATCGNCSTTFSFSLSEVNIGARDVPAGYSPEEEAYSATTFSVACPYCHNSVNVEKYLGPDFKRKAKKPRRDFDFG
jgi:hypothetical protein